MNKNKLFFNYVKEALGIANFSIDPFSLRISPPSMQKAYSKEHEEQGYPDSHLWLLLIIIALVAFYIHIKIETLHKDVFFRVILFIFVACFVVTTIICLLIKKKRISAYIFTLNLAMLTLLFFTLGIVDKYTFEMHPDEEQFDEAVKSGDPDKIKEYVDYQFKRFNKDYSFQQLISVTNVIFTSLTYWSVRKYSLSSSVLMFIYSSVSNMLLSDYSSYESSLEYFEDWIIILGSVLASIYFRHRMELSKKTNFISKYISEQLSNHSAEWLSKIKMAFCLLKDNKRVFSNECFQALQEGKGNILLKLKRYDKQCQTCLIEAIQTVSSDEYFVHIGMFSDGSKIFEAYVTNYPFGFKELMLTDISSVLEVERVKVEGEYKKKCFAKIAHEFKTPLTSMSHIVDDIKTEDEATANKLNLLKNLSEYSLFLANDIITFCLDKNTDLLMESVELLPIVSFGQDVLKTLVRMNDAKFAKVRLALVDDLNKPNIKIHSDEVKLKQMILNFVSNAYKFTSEGSITLRISGEEGLNLCIEVIDTGKGMTEQIRADILEEDKQINVRTADNKMGSGLGLSVCKGIAKQLGMGMSCESKVGEGTTMGLNIPWSLVDFDEEDEDASTVVLSQWGIDSEEAILSNGAKGRKIVIVAEDNQVIRSTIINLVVKAFSSFGAEVDIRECQDGTDIVKEVLSSINNGEEIKMIITDENMDILQGSKAVKLVRNIEEELELKNILSISCSSFMDEEEENQVLQRGIDYVIEKPFPLNKLLNIMEEEQICNTEKKDI